MLEKEIKILEIDTGEIQKKLELVGAKKIFEGFIHDVYYDFHDIETNDLKMETKKRLFRVRQKGDIHMYTIKRKRNNISEGGEKGLKVADEGEREITDVKSFRRVLTKYGMKETREKKKYRISYELNGTHFDIDDYYMGDERNLIPPLLEIESQSLKEINYWINFLDLKNHKKKDWGSRKLFKYYGVEYSWL